MTTEFQPRERLPFYIPENWLPLPPAAGGQQFVNFPTTQTANISFPGTILCSNFQSFAPSASMNLLNNSTIGSINIANAAGYTGGIVINANGTAPVNNTIRIGDSARQVIMPLVKLTDIEPIGVAGIFINSDTTINAGKILSTNSIQAISGSEINIGDKLKIDYPPTVSDLYIGSYRTANYQNLSALTINNTEERIIGSIPFSLVAGVYQVSFNAGLSASNSKPYLSLGLYTNGTIWTDGGLRGTTGTLNNSLYTLSHYFNNNNTQGFSATLSGLLILATTSYIAFVVGNADLNTLSLTSTDTYLSIVRLG